MKKVFFAFIFIFFVGCEPEKDFSEMACDVYESCGFSPVERSFCEEFANYSFNQVPEEQRVLCFDCLESIGCKMWDNSLECEMCF